MRNGTDCTTIHIVICVVCALSEVGDGVRQCEVWKSGATMMLAMSKRIVAIIHTRMTPAAISLESGIFNCVGLGVYSGHRGGSCCFAKV